MKQAKTETHNLDTERRSFLAKIARTLVLLLIGSFVGMLALNKRISASSNDSCVNDSICARCKLKATCVQPQAQSFRDASIRSRFQHRQ